MTHPAPGSTDRLAPAVRAVADVATARYTAPAAPVRHRVRPRVTAAGDRVRIESLSACGSVYARLDVDADQVLAPPPGPVPATWIRGLAEANTLALGLAPVADVAGPAAARFLGALPMFAAPGPDLDLAVARDEVRRVLGHRSGSFALVGCGRLRAAVQLAHDVTRMRLRRGPSGATGWTFDLPGGRLTLVLTPDVRRGFGDRPEAPHPTR